jgi:hypothetical protein
LMVMLVLEASMLTSPLLLTSSTKCVYSEATCGLVLSRWLFHSVHCTRVRVVANGELAPAVRPGPEVGVCQMQ